jgi:hypothetical protein
VVKYNYLWECGLAYNTILFISMWCCVIMCCIYKIWLYILVYDIFCSIWCVVNVGIHLPCLIMSMGKPCTINWRLWVIGKTVPFHGETTSSSLRSNFYHNSTSTNFGFSNKLICFIGHGYGYGVAPSRTHTLRVPSLKSRCVDKP